MIVISGLLVLVALVLLSVGAYLGSQGLVFGAIAVVVLAAGALVALLVRLRDEPTPVVTGGEPAPVGPQHAGGVGPVLSADPADVDVRSRTAGPGADPTPQASPRTAQPQPTPTTAAGPPDTQPLDAEPSDVQPLDEAPEPDVAQGCQDGAGSPADAQQHDAAASDEHPVDAGSVDAGSVDAGSVEAGAVDAGSVDAGSVEAGAVDAGSVEAGAVESGSVLAAKGTGHVLAEGAGAGPADAEPGAGADERLQAARVGQVDDEPGEEGPVDSELEYGGLVHAVPQRLRYHAAGCVHLHGQAAVCRDALDARDDGYAPCGACCPDATLKAEYERVQQLAGATPEQHAESLPAASLRAPEKPAPGGSGSDPCIDGDAAVRPGVSAGRETSTDLAAAGIDVHPADGGSAAVARAEPVPDARSEDPAAEPGDQAPAGPDAEPDGGERSQEPGPPDMEGTTEFDDEAPDVSDVAPRSVPTAGRPVPVLTARCVVAAAPSFGSRPDPDRSRTASVTRTVAPHRQPSARGAGAGQGKAGTGRASYGSGTATVAGAGARRPARNTRAPGLAGHPARPAADEHPAGEPDAAHRPDGVPGAGRAVPMSGASSRSGTAHAVAPGRTVQRRPDAVRLEAPRAVPVSQPSRAPIRTGDAGRPRGRTGAAAHRTLIAAASATAQRCTTTADGSRPPARWGVLCVRPAPMPPDPPSTAGRDAAGADVPALGRTGPDRAGEGVARGAARPDAGGHDGAGNGCMVVRTAPHVGAVRP